MLVIKTEGETLTFSDLRHGMWCCRSSPGVWPSPIIILIHRNWQEMWKVSPWRGPTWRRLGFSAWRHHTTSFALVWKTVNYSLLWSEQYTGQRGDKTAQTVPSWFMGEAFRAGTARRWLCTTHCDALAWARVEIGKGKAESYYFWDCTVLGLQILCKLNSYW